MKSVPFAIDTGRRAKSAAAPLQAGCFECDMHAMCLPMGFSEDELERFDSLVERRLPVPRGGTLFRLGDRFESVFALRSGFFKTTRVTSSDRRTHVVGFHMPGELLGLEGIGNGCYTCDALALEESVVCVIPYARLEAMCRQINELQRQFHKIMSREIACNHERILLLTRARAQERLAAFLLNLTRRLQARGASPAALVLRMTRYEIGTHLGLTLETVSRCFSRLEEAGVLQVRQRQIHILDRDALQALVNP
jgi:CRP/FNR family transcriptional regulator